MVTVSMGNKRKTFRSIREAAKVAKVPYMTYYMRLRFGVHPRTAANRPVRQYRKAA